MNDSTSTHAQSYAGSGIRSMTMLRRQSIGQEGASAEFCDLSGRGLNTSQVERTLRVFDTAVAIDMSNNELELIPTTIPTDITAIDLSFNMLVHAHGIERLQFLRELNLGYNRLADATVLEFCPLLLRVNLSGNRLASTRGLETLAHLENLDLSDNLIEYADELRSLSMNSHLTHLTIRGNPIAHKASVDYRVLVLDMIPSVLILDDKKIRATAKTRPQEATASSAAVPGTKSLSYSRIYDDKKQFVFRNQQTRRTPATRPTPVLLGDPTVPTKYEGTTIFLKSPKATTITHDAAVPQALSPVKRGATVTSQTPVHGPQMTATGVRLASPTAATGGQYMSLYDRLAAANGITKRPDESPTPAQTEANTTATTRPASSQSRRDPKALVAKNQPTTTPHSRPTTGNDRPPSRGGQSTRPQTPAVPPASAARPATPSTQPPAAQQQATWQYQPAQSVAHPQQGAYRAVQPSTASAAVASSYFYAASPPPAPSYHSPVPQPHASMAVSPGPPSASANQLDSKQQNVLSVIQNLIHHKKQTLATLARQAPAGSAATTVFSS